MTEALLLEWEGVLVETRELRHTALRSAFEAERLTIPAILIEDTDDAADVELSVSRALAEAGHPDDHALREIVSHRARRAFAQRMSQGVLLVPGAQEFVESCRHRARIVIVTDAGRTETEQLVRQAGWDTTVSAVVASDDLPAASGWPERIARALEQLMRRGVSQPQDVLLLGHLVAAFRAARAAGIRSVAVGAPAHVAVDADGAVASLGGQTFDTLASVARSYLARDTR